jgi:integrase
MEKNRTATTMKAWKELKAQDYPGGVKLTTKELRDYFATQVSAQVSDPKIVMNLMRHTSLDTTTLYTRTVTERMKHAVRNLGQILGAVWGHLPGAKIPKVTRCEICSLDW